MKVSTDACIQGAWTPINHDVQHVLDVGCGTGLLSLMLAQRNHAIEIDAIELDPNAALDAADNIDRSPWKERINVAAGDVKDYKTDKQYDLIVCNPPFFQNNLLSGKEDRRMARHTISLSYSDLFAVIQRHLSSAGYSSVMLPSAEHEIWENLVLKNNWSIIRKLLVRPRVGLGVIRVVSLCVPAEGEIITEHLTIYDGNVYTSEFIHLLSPYYLKL